MKARFPLCGSWCTYAGCGRKRHPKAMSLSCGWEGARFLFSPSLLRFPHLTSLSSGTAESPSVGSSEEVQNLNQPQREIHTALPPHSKGKPPYFVFSLPAGHTDHATHMGKIRQKGSTGSAEALQITPTVLNPFLTAFGQVESHFQQVRNTSPPQKCHFLI